MAKFDKDKYFSEITKIFDDLNKIQSTIEIVQTWSTVIPNFLENIWKNGYSAGFKEGIEEGKRQKIENLTKQN